MIKHAWIAGLFTVIGLLVGMPVHAQVVQSTPIPNQYIITLRDDVPGVEAVAKALAASNNGKLLRIYQHALKGFVITVPPAIAEALQKSPFVTRVEQDAVIQIEAMQSSATVGLDRIDQRALPLNTNYSYVETGAGVHVYVIDTGIHPTHTEFSGRVGNGFTSIDDGNGTFDCNGHGTHVAGTIGGTIYGVAKEATLHPVRVLGCNGAGTLSSVIAGIDWITANHSSPAVANMSLGGGYSASVNDAVKRSIVSGVTYALAAGNSNADACNTSPASTPEAITVGAIQISVSDTVASFSNWGSCLDLYAPGVNITSAWAATATSTATLSGTSMASPHVAGVAALYLESNPTATPAQVGSAVVASATTGLLTSLSTGSPNKILFSLFNSSEPTPTPVPQPDTVAPSVPQGVKAVQSPLGIDVSWSASSDNVGVVGYRVYRGTTLIASTSVLKVSDASVTLGSTYTYTVKAIDAKGNLSGASSGFKITVPKFKINHSVNTGTLSKATISWSTNYLSTATVIIKKSGKTVATLSSASPGTSHSLTFSNLSRGTYYSYEIKATRSGGTGSGSASGSFKTR